MKFTVLPPRPKTPVTAEPGPDLFVGPVVRVNPDELHINDSTFVEKIYVNPANVRRKIRVIGSVKSKVLTIWL